LDRPRPREGQPGFRDNFSELRISLAILRNVDQPERVPKG